MKLTKKEHTKYLKLITQRYCKYVMRFKKAFPDVDFMCKKTTPVRKFLWEHAVMEQYKAIMEKK